MANAWSDSRPSKDYGKRVCCHRCFELFFVPTLHLTLMRFIENESVMATPIRLGEDGMDDKNQAD